MEIIACLLIASSPRTLLAGFCSILLCSCGTAQVSVTLALRIRPGLILGSPIAGGKQTPCIIRMLSQSLRRLLLPRVEWGCTKNPPLARTPGIPRISRPEAWLSPLRQGMGLSSRRVKWDDEFGGQAARKAIPSITAPTPPVPAPPLHPPAVPFRSRHRRTLDHVAGVEDAVPVPVSIAPARILAGFVFASREDLANTYFGDADLNGEFNSSDMVQVFANGKYETGRIGELGRRRLEW